MDIRVHTDMSKCIDKDERVPFMTQTPDVVEEMHITDTERY